MKQVILEYPALVYKKRKNLYVANCIAKRLVCYGKSEKAAVFNLENVLNRQKTDFPIKVKPVYKNLVINCLN